MTFIENGPGDVTLGEADRAAALAEVKAALHLVANDEDALIAAYAETALGLAEQFLGRVLIVRAMTERLPASACWQALGAAPVMAITAVSRVGSDGIVALPVEAYAIDLDAEANGWVRLTAPDGDPVAVAYQAGWLGGWTMIPAPVRQGVVMLAAHLYAARDAREPPPAAVTALWRPFRAVALDRAARA